MQTAITFNSLLVALLGSFSFTVLVEMDFLLYSLTIMLGTVPSPALLFPPLSSLFLSLTLPYFGIEEYGAWMKLRISHPEMDRPYRLPFSQGPQRIVSGILLILAPFSLTLFNFYFASHTSQVSLFPSLSPSPPLPPSPPFLPNILHRSQWLAWWCWEWPCTTWRPP